MWEDDDNKGEDGTRSAVEGPQPDETAAVDDEDDVEAHVWRAQS